MCRERKLNYKPFSKEDHASSDPLSRYYAVQCLTSLSSNFHLATPLEDQKEEYKRWDFIINYGNKTLAVETEQKKVWTRTDGTFQYRTIDVPTRKKKSEADLYLMFNSTFDVVAMTEMDKILNADTITKSTRRASGEYITQGETFFSVPVSSFRFYVTGGTAEWTRV